MDNFRRVAGPASEVVPVIEARSHSRLEAIDDGTLAGFLLEARESIERACSLALITQTWDLLLDTTWPCVFDKTSGCYMRRIEIPLAPLQSITSITYVDVNGATQTLAADQYRVVRTALHNKRGWVVPAYGVTWPTPRFQVEAITVRFVSGFGLLPADVPNPIRLAIKLVAAHFNENREASTVADLKALPAGAASLLSDYIVGGYPDGLAGL